MKKIILFIVIAIININSVFSQGEINLVPESKEIGTIPYLFSIKSIDNSKLLVKYLCVPACLVKSSDESTFDGVVNSKSNDDKFSSIRLSDIVVALVEQEVDVASKSQKFLRKNLIAFRKTDPLKTYSISLEGVSNTFKYIEEGEIVAYNLDNLSKIPEITPEEIKGLNNVYTIFENSNRGRTVNFSSHPVFAGTPVESSKVYSDVMSTNAYSHGLTENENILKYEKLDRDVEYLFTRDRRIKKDVGVAYKTYFIGNGGIYKADSIFYAERSGTEKPQEVYNVDKRKYTGVLSRLSCESLNKGSDLTFFRYTYYDFDRSIRRFRFQTPDGKLRNLTPERTFRVGDTIVHLTENKGIYQSSILTNDTIKLRYPLSNQDTLQYNNLYCPNLPVGGNAFGSKNQIFMNVKFKDFLFLGEQSISSKMSAGLTDMNAPDAQEKGFSITKIYVINNNAVKSVNKIMVPYFSSETALFHHVLRNDIRDVYLIKMSYPVFLWFSDKGQVNIRQAAMGVFLPQIIPSSNSYHITWNDTLYLSYRNPQTGGSKLVAVNFK